MSRLSLALVLLIVGLIFDVGRIIGAGKIILIVLLVGALVGILSSMAYGGRHRAG